MISIAAKFTKRIRNNLLFAHQAVKVLAAVIFVDAKNTACLNCAI